jgi:hypothetical protein
MSDPVIIDTLKYHQEQDRLNAEYTRATSYCDQLMRDLSIDDLCEALQECDADVQARLLKAFKSGNKDQAFNWLCNIVEAHCWSMAEKLCDGDGEI